MGTGGYPPWGKTKGRIAVSLLPADRVEGKTTRIAYIGPRGRSTLEVIRNCKQILARNGFEIVFKATGAALNPSDFVHALYPGHGGCNASAQATDNPPRYLYARLDDGKRRVWATPTARARPTARSGANAQ